MNNDKHIQALARRWPILLASFFATATGGHAFADGSHHVRSYVTKRGTYVAPHRQTNPDHSKLNNWSSKGNVNPYTGKPGTKDPSTP